MALDGKLSRIAQIIDAAGRVIGYKNPITGHDEESVPWTAAKKLGVVSGDGKGTRIAADGAFALDDAIDTPLRIPNCELWLDASSGAVDAAWAPCADGGACAVVLDNSGNGRHATVTSGTYQATGGHNGMPGVLGKMVTSGFLASGWGSAITVFCVSKPTSSAGLRIKVGFGGAFYLGYNNTSSQRDLSMGGVTPSGSSVGVQTSGGLDCIAIDAAVQRVITGGYGIQQNSSNAVMTRSSTGGLSLSSTAVTVGGYAGTGAYDWGAPVSEVLIFSRYLTDSEFRRVWAYLSAKYESLPLVVTLGNSLMSGFGASGGGATQDPKPTGTNPTSRLLARMPGQIRVITDCYPGRTGEQIFSESQAWTALISAFGPKTISVVWEGTNSLATHGSPRKAYEAIVQICKAKRTATTRPVVVCTVLTRGDTGNDAKNAALTAQLNALLRANYLQFADRLCDLAADARLSNFNNATYFNGDKTHLTDAGYDAVAELIQPHIAALIA